MAFCLNTLLDPGYAPGGTWEQISGPGGVTFLPDNSDDQGCINIITIENGKITVSGIDCIAEGEFIFEYTPPGCFSPIQVSLTTIDSPVQIATPPDLYVCRDGSESTNSQYNYYLADGTPIDELFINDYIRQCDGTPATYPIEIRRNSTGATTINNPSANDRYTFNWFNFNNAVDFPNGFPDYLQSCTELVIKRPITIGQNCGDQIPFRLIVSPKFEGSNETIDTCDNNFNIFDNIPQDLKDFINFTTSGQVDPSGNLALYNLNTVGYNGCSSTGTIQIQYSTDGINFIDLLTSSSIDPAVNPNITYKTIWTPSGATVGFDCGVDSILTLNNNGCCLDDPGIPCQEFLIEESGFSHGITIGGTTEQFSSTPGWIINNSTIQQDLLDYLNDVACNTVTIEIDTDNDLVRILNFNGVIDSLNNTSGTYLVQDCCDPVTSLTWISGGCQTAFTCPGVDEYIKQGSGGCDYNAIVFEADFPVETWTISNILGSSFIVASTSTTVDIGPVTDTSQSCSGDTYNARFIITATSCGQSISKEVIVAVAF